MKISVAIIAKNEEKDIRDCIMSFIDEVDEVVVIDNGSVDKTVSIAKETSKKVWVYPYETESFTFSALRNYSIMKCKGDWILYIDCDERMMTKNIREILEKQEEDVGALKVLITSRSTEGSKYYSKAFLR